VPQQILLDTTAATSCAQTSLFSTCNLAGSSADVDNSSVLEERLEEAVEGLLVDIWWRSVSHNLPLATEGT
jgi:hypothetical protein